MVAAPAAFTNVYPEWNALAALDLIGDFTRAGFLPDRLGEISSGPRSFIEQARALTPAECSAYRAHIRRLETEAAAFFRDRRSARHAPPRAVRLMPPKARCRR